MNEIEDNVSVKPMWCDRLRPRQFSECLMHKKINAQLQSLTCDSKARNEFPHVLITGPTGSGKRTRASCLIASLFHIRRSEIYKIYNLLPNNGDENSQYAAQLEQVLERINFTVIDGVEYAVSEEQKKSDECNIPVNLVLTRAKTINCDKAKDGIQILHSPVHVEMTPHDVNYCDTKIVQTTLKTLFENNEFDLLTFGSIPSLNRYRKEENSTTQMDHTNPNFRIFVFNNVDKMSREAQTALRRIMEDYSTSVRFILIAVNLDHVCAPIQSRCHLITLPRPSDEVIQTVLKSALSRVLPTAVTETVDYQQSVTGFVARLTKQSEGNVTKALTVLQASLQAYVDSPAAMVSALTRCEISQPDWVFGLNECVSQICQVNMRSGSTRHLFIKEKLGELLKRRVPTEYIVRYFDKQVRKTLRDQFKLVSQAIEQLLKDTTNSPEEHINDEERLYLEKRLNIIRCQLAGVCSDITSACAFYETRSTKSQYAIIHINALALCLVVIVGLYQNSLAVALDSDKHLRVCRPYSSVYDLSRLLRHTMQKKRIDFDSLPKTDLSELIKEESNTAEMMKKMCFSSASTLAGVDWSAVRSKIESEQKINIAKVLVDN